MKVRTVWRCSSGDEIYHEYSIPVLPFEMNAPRCPTCGATTVFDRFVNFASIAEPTTSLQLAIGRTLGRDC